MAPSRATSIPGSPRFAPVTTTAGLNAACAAVAPTSDASMSAHVPASPSRRRRPPSTASMQSLPADDLDSPAAPQPRAALPEARAEHISRAPGAAPSRGDLHPAKPDDRHAQRGATQRVVTSQGAGGAGAAGAGAGAGGGSTIGAAGWSGVAGSRPTASSAA